MATNEPPQRKRKVDEVTPTEEGKSVEENTPILCIWKEGRYVPVAKDSQESYVSALDSDEDVDPVLEQEYYRQIRESGGFDCDVHIANGSLMPCKYSDDDKNEIVICAKVGLHWYNVLKGSNYRLLRVEKYNSVLTGFVTYYITANVIDPASNLRFVFQTCVTQSTCCNNENFRIVTEYSGIKSETQGSEDQGSQWEDEAVDDFYKGDLKWLPDDALVLSGDKQQQYYEIQDSEIRENYWLNLYADYALFTLWERRLTKLKFAAPLEIKKVVVQTREAMEPKEKLKAGNANFYISFRDCGLTEDHRAVVRRTTDGHPGHICLEVMCPVEDLSSFSMN